MMAHHIVIGLLGVSLAGCRSGNSDIEQPAPAERFVVTTSDGQQLTGPDARIDIRFFPGATVPDVEMFFMASDASGNSWAARARPSPDFLQRRTHTAAVMTGPLEVGHATVERRSSVGALQLAPSGELRLRLENRLLQGELSRASGGLDARFGGPFAVTCSVPMSGGQAPTGDSGGSALTVDTAFETALCRPFAALAGR